jgi:hypothetical protein
VWKVNNVKQFQLVFPQSNLDSEGLDIVIHIGNELIFTLELFVKIIQMISHIHKKRKISYPFFIIQLFNISALLFHEKFDLIQQIKNSFQNRSPN